MEQKKVLLVVVSVGAFLAIAIVAGMFLFAPKGAGTGAGKPIEKDFAPAAQEAAADTAANAGPVSVDANEWVRDPSKVAGLQPSAQQATSTRGDVIIIYGEKPNVDVTSRTAGADRDGRIVLDLPASSGPVVPAPLEQPAVPGAYAERKPEATDPAAKNAAPVPAPAKKPAAVQEAPKNAPAAAKSAGKPALKMVDEFWVQTGAFSAKVRADDASVQLKTKGITSLVETKDVNGKTFYRVRLGPYSSQNEADYWLALVKTVDGFGESYVSMTKAKR